MRFNSSIDAGVFYEVIVPLMEVEGTATICISTPLGSFNFYSELTKITDDKGKPVFNVRHIKGDKVPSWKPEEARSKIEAIYGNRTTLMKREIHGEIADEGDNMAFDADKIRRFMDKPPLSAPYHINDNLIYVAIDPNGGASASNAPGSDTAIVSFVISEGRVVIVGLESFPTTGPAQSRLMVYKHLEELRKQACFKHCRYMLIPEANLGNEAQMLSQMCLRRYADVDIMCQKPHAYGVFTVPGDPERYVMRLQDKLAEDGLFMHDKPVCASPCDRVSKTPAIKWKKVLEEFHRQLTSFRGVYIVPASYNARVTLVWTGKADKDGKRSNRAKDDLVLALLLGYFYCTQYNSVHNLVNKRDAGSQLRLAQFAGTALEGGNDGNLAELAKENAPKRKNRA